MKLIAQRPEAGPEELERLVGIPIETVLIGIPGPTSLRGTAMSDVPLPVVNAKRDQGRG